VTVGNELPNAQGQQGQGGASREASNKNEEVTNFEISRTTRTEVLEGGRLRRLSVAVLVDGVYARPANGGEPAYQPRTQEELDRIGALVRTAIGFDRDRGDQVEVVNLRFADAPAPLDMREQTLMQQLFSFTKDDLLRAIEVGVIGLLVLIVLLTVVRPLMKQIVAPDGRRSTATGPDGEQIVIQTITGPDGQVQQIAAPREPETPSERMLAMAQIKGQIKAQSVEKIGQMVKQNPGDSVAVLRGWIHESAAVPS
jgi:flagellar M-ring protein FliF